MKILTTILIGASCAGMASAEFATWTNKEGKSVDLNLVKVTQVEGQAQGEFKMRDGRTATLKASDLTAADSKRLTEWKPAVVAAPAATSVFDEFLGDDLVSLKGKSLASHKNFVKPTKY